MVNLSLISKDKFQKMGFKNKDPDAAVLVFKNLRYHNLNIVDYSVSVLVCYPLH